STRTEDIGATKNVTARTTIRSAGEERNTLVRVHGGVVFTGDANRGQGHVGSHVQRRRLGLHNE
ncbi:hypothetical protein A2U01_0117034, partial [Trifolium medium]|nr:hypothetical protein [Trifolium medium]